MVTLRSWSLVLLIASVQSACSPGEAKVSLEWPPLQPGATSIVVSLREDRILGVNVVEAGTESSIELVVPGGGAKSIEMYGLAYPESRTDLGLPAGALALGSKRSLPPPALIHHARLTADVPGAWQPIETLPESILELRLAQSIEAACAVAFAPRILDFALPGAPEDGYAVMSSALEDGSALILQRGGLAFRVRVDGAVLEPSLSSTTAIFWGGAQSPDGSVWLRRNDAILRGTPARGFSEISPFPYPARIRTWLAPRVRAGGQVDLLTLTDLGSIDHFDGHTWSHIGDVPVVVLEDALETGGGILWLGDTDTALLVSPIYYACADSSSAFTCGRPVDNSTRVWLIRGGQLEATPSPPNPIEGAWLTEGRRIFASTLDGPVYELIDEQWVESLDLGSRVSVSYPSSHGLLFGLLRREIALLHPILGLCTQPLRDLGAVRFMSPIEGGIVLAKSRDFVQRRGGDRVSVLLW